MSAAKKKWLETNFHRGLASPEGPMIKIGGEKASTLCNKKMYRPSLPDQFQLQIHQIENSGQIWSGSRFQTIVIDDAFFWDTSSLQKNAFNVFEGSFTPKKEAEKCKCCNAFRKKLFWHNKRSLKSEAWQPWSVEEFWFLLQIGRGQNTLCLIITWEMCKRNEIDLEKARSSFRRKKSSHQKFFTEPDEIRQRGGTLVVMER